MRLRAVVAVGLGILAAVHGCRSDDESTEGRGSAGSAGSAAQGGEGGDGGTSTVGLGTLILEGTLVTPDQVIEGQIRIDGTEIVCVGEGTACQDEAPAAELIATNGVIAPGLIDTHNHILFDIFDETDWAPNLPGCIDDTDCETSPYCDPDDCACMDGACKYKDHDQWPNEDEYVHMLDYKQCLEDASQGKPVWCPRTYDGAGELGCEMDKWGEMKGLVAGTTSIVGLPGTSSRCFESVARSIDVQQNGLEEDKVQTSALFPPSEQSASNVCENFTSGDTEAYLIHVGEGTNDNALDEFTTLFTVSTPDGCLYAPQTTITHGTALGPAEFDQMAAAGMKLTWSPASNLALYGTTTDIPSALAAGVLVSLAPDWSMGGSQNLLDELRVADAWDDAEWGDQLTPKMLVEMVTSNPAATLGLADVIGRLDVGMKADIVVFERLHADAYRSITMATPAEVQLVILDGQLVYGDPDLVDVEPPLNTCEEVSICGVTKSLCVSVPGEEQYELGQTYAEIEAALEAGLADLDAIMPLAPGACTPACGAGDECFERTVHEQVDESMCGGCASDQGCFRTAQSGNNQYNCLSLNACAPAKLQAMAPLTPLVRCP